MGQSARAIAIVALLITPLIALSAWVEEKPGVVAWTLRITSAVVVPLSAGLLIRNAFRKDLAPDFLGRRFENYLNRDGLCFMIVPTVIGGTFYFETWYQNQYERRSEGMVALRRGLSLIATISIECEPAAYGRVLVPYGVHASYQGTERTFEVYAAVRYPEGRGKLLRFRAGLPVGRGKLRVGSKTSARPTMILPPVVTHERSARAKLLLPANVAEEITDQTPVYAETLWRLGDPAEGIPDVTAAC